jgi:hypothetical protein
VGHILFARRGKQATATVEEHTKGTVAVWRIVENGEDVLEGVFETIDAARKKAIEVVEKGNDDWTPEQEEMLRRSANARMKED